MFSGTVSTTGSSVAARAVRGAAWNLVAGVGSRIVALVGTVVLTHFIAPGEYGEIAAATITTATALMLTDANVGQTILAKRAGPVVCFHALVVHMVTGACGLVVLLLVARPLGRALDVPEMARFVPWFAGAAVLERFAHVPSRVLVRELRFRTVAVTRGTAELVFTAVALALAPWIHGYAIVAGNVARWALIVLVYMLRVDRREWLVPQPLRRATIRDLLQFGIPLWAGNLAEFASGNWDNLLVGRFFGPSTMGAYRLSRNLADTPTTNVAEHIGDVLLPSFALMDESRRRSALVRASAIMALLVVPLSAGLAAVAPTLAETLFDRRWAEIGPMLMILSALMAVRPITWALTSFLQAEQRPGSLMRLGFLKVGSVLVLVTTLGRFGAGWTCLAVGLAFVIHSVASVVVACRARGVPAAAFAAGVTKPMVASAVMFVCVVAVRPALRSLGAGPGWGTLVVQVLAGMAIYVAAAFLVARSTLGDVLGVVRSAVARGPGPSPAHTRGEMPVQ